MFNLRNLVRYDTGDGTGGTGGDDGQSGSGGDLTLDSWIEALEDADQKKSVKTLLGTHVGKLESALKSERVTRKDMEKQVRDLAKQAEDGSDSQAQLTQLADDLEKAGQKSDFYEVAHLAGVSNLKLAYMAAVQDDLFDRKGNVDFAAMKESYPELFAGTQEEDGDAGRGTGGELPEGSTMDDYIRGKAGI
ncbi:MAG: hypothetical protein DRI32_00435 [Chloroflexi bacterium]|nr:MAG: hypothetical protein DRI32_00435 [Chloroflexota bacterium]